MRRDRVPARPNQRQKRHQHRGDASLQPSRRADADELPHEQAEIEAAGVNQQSLANVGVAPEIDATKTACLIQMGEGAFEALAAKPQQAQAARTANPATV